MTAVAPIVDPGKVNELAFKDFAGVDPALLEQVILAATAEINSFIAPRKIPQAAYTDPYDGAGAVGRYGHLIYLDHYPVTTITSVKENGTTLTVATTYSTSADVIADLALGRLVRVAGNKETAWAYGRANIEISVTAGYADPATEAPDIAQVCIDLAALIYKTGRRVGSQGATRSDSAISYIYQLPDRDLATLRRYGGHGRPRCRSAA